MIKKHVLLLFILIINLSCDKTKEANNIKKETNKMENILAV